MSSYYALPSICFVGVNYYSHLIKISTKKFNGVANDALADQIIYVCNNARLQGVQLPIGAGANIPIRRINHDNEGQEFGAYQAGLQAILQERDPDWILFMNDTVGVHRPFPSAHRRNLMRALREPVDPLPVCVGEVEAIDRSYSIAGVRSHRWASTHVFALNRAAVQALSGRVYRAELNSLVKGGFEERTFFSAELDKTLIEHFGHWLFQENRSRYTWDLSEPLSASNEPRLSAKARSLVQEKHLSAMLDSASARFVDIQRTHGFVDRAIRRLESTLSQAITGGRSRSTTVGKTLLQAQVQEPPDHGGASEGGERI